MKSASKIDVAILCDKTTLNFILRKYIECVFNGCLCTFWEFWTPQTNREVVTNFYFFLNRNLAEIVLLWPIYLWFIRVEVNCFGGTYGTAQLIENAKLTKRGNAKLVLSANFHGPWLVMDVYFSLGGVKWIASLNVFGNKNVMTSECNLKYWPCFLVFCNWKASPTFFYVLAIYWRIAKLV